VERLVSAHRQPAPTRKGVGNRCNPPLWMKAGDVLDVENGSAGTLRTRAVDE